MRAELLPTETGRKLGKVAQPLRAALTGRATSPGIFDVLDVLGRDESLARFRDQSSWQQNLHKICAGRLVALRHIWRDRCRSAKKALRQNAELLAQCVAQCALNSVSSYRWS